MCSNQIRMSPRLKLFTVKRRLLPELYKDYMPEHLPTYTTLRIPFTRFLDFSAVPRRSFFQYNTLVIPHQNFIPEDAEQTWRIVGEYKGCFWVRSFSSVGGAG